MAVGGRLSATTEQGGQIRKKVMKQKNIKNICKYSYIYMYHLSPPGDLHQHQHCVQHQSPDQAEDEDRQDHEAPDCHPLSVPHIRVPSGE